MSLKTETNIPKDDREVEEWLKETVIVVEQYKERIENLKTAKELGITIELNKEE